VSARGGGAHDGGCGAARRGADTPESAHTPGGDASGSGDTPGGVFRPEGRGASGGSNPHIKSYVLQKQRMTKAQASAYERLFDAYCTTLSDVPRDPRILFDHPERPLVLEIGFGMGRTTARLAQALPETNFLGVEVHRPGVGKLLHEIEHRELSNIRIVQDDAVELLRSVIVDPRFDGIHVFFPDPWPKKRHHKRRLIRPGIVEILRDRLRPGGYLYVTTDWEDYAQQILAVLEETPGLENRYEGFAPRQEWRPKTAFEDKGLAQEHRIYEVYFTRPLR
jgi:tRNA (guanine-N7-)-methyltransferase